MYARFLLPSGLSMVYIVKCKIDELIFYRIERHKY